MKPERFKVIHAVYGPMSGPKLDGYEQMRIEAGRPRTRRIIPPAGADHAFDIEVWPVRVEVYVSPTGRSVRVFVNGTEVPK